MTSHAPIPSDNDGTDRTDEPDQQPAAHPDDASRDDGGAVPADAPRPDDASRYDETPSNPTEPIAPGTYPTAPISSGYPGQQGGNAGSPPPPPSDGAGAFPPPPGGPAPSQSNPFFSWFRNLGIQRGQDRWIGGVASGLGHRIGLDPILVRGLFILLAIFGGVGVLLYGVAWALLPEPDGRIHAEEAGRSNWTAGMTGAVIFAVLGIFSRPFGWFNNDWGWGFGGFVWAVIWIGAVAFFIYWLATRNKNNSPAGSHGPGSEGFPPAPPASGSGTTSYSSAESTYGPAAGTDYTAAGYGASSGGYQGPPRHNYPQPRPYPQPAPQPPKPVHRGPSGAAIALTLGAAMLAAGVVLGLNALEFVDLGLNVVPVAIAAALIVIGIGVVVMGSVGRTSGVLGFLAAVGLVLSLVFSAGMQWTASNFAIASSRTWTSTAAPAEGDGYSVVAGNGTVDLREVSGSRFGGPAVVPVNAVAASVTVIIPDDAPVKVESRMALGNVEYTTAGDSGESSGIWQPGDFIINDDGGAPEMVVSVRGVVSSVDIVTMSEFEETR